MLQTTTLSVFLKQLLRGFSRLKGAGRLTQDVVAFRPAVEKKVKCRKVWNEGAPKLGINWGGRRKEDQLDLRLLKNSGFKIFGCRMMGYIAGCPQVAANVNKQRISFAGCADVRLQEHSCVNQQMSRQVMDCEQIELQKPFNLSTEHLLDDVKMLVEIRGVSIKGLQTGKMFSRPGSVVTYADLVDLLQSKTLFPDRDGQPKGALVVLESVSVDPGGAPGKLNVIEEHHYIRQVGLVKEG